MTSPAAMARARVGLVFIRPPPGRRRAPHGARRGQRLHGRPARVRRAGRPSGRGQRGGAGPTGPPRGGRRTRSAGARASASPVGVGVDDEQLGREAAGRARAGPALPGAGSAWVTSSGSASARSWSAYRSRSAASSYTPRASSAWPTRLTDTRTSRLVAPNGDWSRQADARGCPRKVSGTSSPEWLRSARYSGRWPVWPAHQAGSGRVTSPWSRVARVTVRGVVTGPPRRGG